MDNALTGLQHFATIAAYGAAIFVGMCVLGWVNYKMAARGIWKMAVVVLWLSLMALFPTFGVYWLSSDLKNGWAWAGGLALMALGTGLAFPLLRTLGVQLRELFSRGHVTTQAPYYTED